MCLLRALDDGHVAAALGLATLARDEGAVAAAEALLNSIPFGARPRHERAIAALPLRLDAAHAGPVATLRARLDAAADDHEARIALVMQDAAAGQWAEAFAGWLEVVRRDRGAYRDRARVKMVEGFTACGDGYAAKRWRGLPSMELFS